MPNGSTAVSAERSRVAGVGVVVTMSVLAVGFLVVGAAGLPAWLLWSAVGGGGSVVQTLSAMPEPLVALHLVAVFAVGGLVSAFVGVFDTVFMRRTATLGRLHQWAVVCVVGGVVWVPTGLALGARLGEFGGVGWVLAALPAAATAEGYVVHVHGDPIDSGRSKPTTVTQRAIWPGRPTDGGDEGTATPSERDATAENDGGAPSRPEPSGTLAESRERVEGETDG